MTAQAGYLPSSAGTVVTEASGAAPATDTIPDACVLLLRNTGAGTHIVTLGTAGLTFDGLGVGAAGGGAAARTYTLLTRQVMLVRVPTSYGDANGRGTLSGDAPAAEVKYSVIRARRWRP